MIFTPTDHRNDPRILYPRVQRPRTVSGCQAEVVNDLMQWEHPFGKSDDGGHSCAMFHRLSQEFRLHPGDTMLDILSGVMEVGTTTEWKYPTRPPNTFDKPLPDSVRQGAIKGVIQKVTHWTGDASKLPYYLGEYTGVTGKKGRLVGVSMPWNADLRRPYPDGIIYPGKHLPLPPGEQEKEDGTHYVTFVDLVPMGRRHTLHYVYNPHRGKEYGHNGYGYYPKILFDRRDRECKFYVLN